MYQNYLITGATGFLGRAVLQLLLAHSCRILALVMDKDPLAYMIPENATVFCGPIPPQTPKTGTAWPSCVQAR